MTSEQETRWLRTKRSSAIPATGKAFRVPCIDVFHLEDGKVSAFDCHYAGTNMLGQLGVLGNLRAAVKK